MNSKIKKVISWRFVSFICAGLISYAYLGELRRSLTLTIILTITMTVIHYIFEILWEKYIENGKELPMDRVVNLFKDSYEIYIGRPGKGRSGYFGNPIQIGKPCPECGEIHNREHTLICYEIYARNRIKEDKVFRERVKGLHNKILGCFCKPKACHGDVLVHLSRELQEN